MTEPIKYKVGPAEPLVQEETLGRNIVTDPQRYARSQEILSPAYAQEGMGEMTSGGTAEAVRYVAPMFGRTTPQAAALSFLGEVIYRRMKRGDPVIEVPSGAMPSEVRYTPEGTNYLQALDTPETDEAARITRDYIEDFKQGAKAAALMGLFMKGYDKIGGRMIRWAENKTAGLGKKLFLPRESMVPEEAKIAQAVVGEFGSSLAIPQFYPPGSSSFMAEVVEGAVGGGLARERLDLRNAQGVMKLIYNEIAHRQAAMEPSAFGDGLVNSIIGTRGSRTGDWGLFYQIKDKLYSDAEALMQKHNLNTNVYPWLKHVKSRLNNDEIRKIFDGLDIWDQEALKRGYKELRPLLSKGTNTWIPLEQAIQIKRKLNKAYSKSRDESVKNVLKDLNGRLSQEIDRHLSSYPDVAAALRTADTFWGEGMKRLNSDFLKSLTKVAQQRPDAVADWFFRRGGLTRLKEVERTFLESGSELGLSKLTPELFEESFLKPLRFRYLQGALDQRGRFVGSALEDMFGPKNAEVTNYLFGEDIRKRLFDLGTTLKWVESGRKSANVAIKLIQGGYIVRLGLVAAAGAHSYGEGGFDVKRFTKEGAVVFLSPIALSKVILNPKFLRLLTDGIKAGPGTVEFEKAMTKLAATKISERVEYNKMKELGKDVVDFFSQPKGRLPTVQGMPDAEFGVK